MKRLLVAAALAPLVFAASARAGTITGADKNTHSTSAEGDITINAGASVTPPTSTTSGTVAVLLNSNNSVTNNGAITVTETTTGDTTNEGVTTGPFANGSDRFGIEVAGSGPFTGDITTAPASSISVIGENSAGIAVETGLNGSISDGGSITVTGGNANTTDVSYGLLIAPGASVTGDVTIGGPITATGQNATGAAIDGNVGGALVVDAGITTSGFRQNTAPVVPSTLAALKPDQLLIGGPALSIGASVVGGVDLVGPTAASGNVAATTGGSLTVFGSAPAMLIGGASPIIDRRRERHLRGHRRGSGHRLRRLSQRQRHRHPDRRRQPAADLERRRRSGRQLLDRAAHRRDRRDRHGQRDRDADRERRGRRRDRHPDRRRRDGPHNRRQRIGHRDRRQHADAGRRGPQPGDRDPHSARRRAR